MRRVTFGKKANMPNVQMHLHGVRPAVLCGMADQQMSRLLKCLRDAKRGGSLGMKVALDAFRDSKEFAPRLAWAPSILMCGDALAQST